MLFIDDLQQADTIHPRHDDIGHQGIEGRLRTKLLECILAIGRPDNFVAFLLEQCCTQFPDLILVLNEENS